MIYSTACAYAIRALTRLTLLRQDGYVLLDEVCQGTDMPRHFVAKIFQDLVRHGLLVSAKGRRGGFALARKPEQITLYDIVSVVDGTEQFKACIVGMAKCDDQQPCPQHEQFKGIRTNIQQYLHQTTLATMAKTLQRKMELIGLELPEPTSTSKPLPGRDGETTSVG